MKIEKQYKKDGDEKLLILNDEIIEQIIKDKENLDFTGFDLEEEGTSSPLSYCIFNDKKDLFIELLNAGADINYQSIKYKWTALHYALRYTDTFFLEKLIETNKLDNGNQLNEQNPLQHILTRQINPGNISKDDFYKRLNLYIKYLSKNIKYENYYKAKNIFNSTYPSQERFDFLIKKLPMDWLNKSINQYEDGSVPMLILSVIGDKPASIKKMLNYLDVNKIFKNGNTFLHTYILETINKSGKNKINPIIVKHLLEMGYDPHWKNKDKVSIDDLIKKEEYYKEYIVKQNYEKLNKELNQKPVEPKKLKM